MEYIVIKDNKIYEHLSAKEIPEGESFRRVINFEGRVGDPINWFDWTKNGKRISENELIKKGIRKDNTGEWWDLNTKEKHTILNLDEEPKETWVKEKPGKYDIADLENKKWEKDTAAELADKKQLKKIQIKANTKNLIEKGVVYNNHTYEMTEIAQLNWQGVFAVKDIEEVYPITIRAKEDDVVFTYAEKSDIEAIYLLGVQKKHDLLKSNKELLDQIEAAQTIETLTDIEDNRS